jgi:hypothetical protein
MATSSTRRQRKESTCSKRSKSSSRKKEQPLVTPKDMVDAYSRGYDVGRTGEMKERAKFFEMDRAEVENFLSFVDHQFIHQRKHELLHEVIRRMRDYVRTLS